jgi:hypothetical protein
MKTWKHAHSPIAHGVPLAQRNPLRCCLFLAHVHGDKCRRIPSGECAAHGHEAALRTWTREEVQDPSKQHQTLCEGSPAEQKEQCIFTRDCGCQKRSTGANSLARWKGTCRNSCKDFQVRDANRISGRAKKISLPTKPVFDQALFEIDLNSSCVSTRSKIEHGLQLRNHTLPCVTHISRLSNASLPPSAPLLPVREAA